MTMDNTSYILKSDGRFVQKGVIKIRQALRQKRIQKGYRSVRKFATKLGISASYYYKIEQNKRNPTIDLAKKIADLLDDTVDNLFCSHNLDDTSNAEAV